VVIEEPGASTTFGVSCHFDAAIVDSRQRATRTRHHGAVFTIDLGRPLHHPRRSNCSPMQTLPARGQSEPQDAAVLLSSLGTLLPLPSNRKRCLGCVRNLREVTSVAQNRACAAY